MDLQPEKFSKDINNILGLMAKEITPWFFQNMHPYYFRFHPEEEIKKHILAIISGKLATDKGVISLESPCGTRFTYITPGENKRALLKILEEFQEKKIQTARVYTSLDGKICLSTFQLYTQLKDIVSREDVPDLKKYFLEKKIIKAEEKEEFSKFISCTSNDYLEKLEKGRIARHFKILKQLKEKEEVLVEVEAEVYAKESRVTIAMNNPPTYGLLLELIKILYKHNLDINRLYLDMFYDKHKDMSSVIISCYLKCTAEDLNKENCIFNLKEDLSLLKWFSSDELEWFYQEKNFSLKKVMLLQASSEFAHQYLLKVNPYAYTQARIKNKLIKYSEITEELIRYFETRFSPFEEARDDLLSVIETNLKSSLKELDDEIAKNILEAILVFYKHILRTNYFLPRPFGLSFRLDPYVLAAFFEQDDEKPFGVYYFYGRLFLGFHVRYRDMARGGLRVVRTKNLEHYKAELHRVFIEAKDLALTQQYKNKDIPEGGAKAVILLHPWGDIDLAVKAMTDSLLDLIVSSKESPCSENIVDYLQRHELIYLGPDENILPKHITWIVNRAKEKNYSWPQALMSSKPVAGINHKQYGVTSLGVIVYMEEVLKFLGIDPYKQEFTVKLTGGPAGDVAGNALKLLIQRYGKRAKILALSDGHGALYDPEGLEHEELLRLVAEGKPSTEFSSVKLKSKEAFVIKADSPQGIKIRNELYNQVVADIFLPCGGRPDTINLKNWENFLKAGVPSAKAIIEGANLFISKQARDKLQEQGVIIIHGSSANKAGVISSSYEILAGLILNEQEFLEIKEEYIKDVLDILEKRARDEARLLLWEYSLRGKKDFLSKITLEISKTINELSDFISDVLKSKIGNLAEDKLWQEQILEYCPVSLVEKYKERILKNTPVRYRFALLGSYLASKLVYKEGLDFIQRIKNIDDLYAFLRIYFTKDKEIRNNLSKLDEKIKEIVVNVGPRYLSLKEILN